MKNQIVPAVLAATSLMAAELPVKRVVLYKHGVGYFERIGEVPAGETARLEFKPNEMNDVLKSLILEGEGASKITGVRYDSAAPAESSIQVDDATSLAAFLDKLRGAKVQLELASGQLAGTLVSGRVIPAAAQVPQQELLVLLTEAGDLRTVNLGGVNAVRLTDPLLQSKLRDHLLSLAGRRTQEQRSVYIDGDSTRARRVGASYLLPTPIWKSSYRLILRDKPLLEGWAIVDNTTDSDWTNISLLLVSGKPVSFQSRLYDPKYIDRPFAELAEERAALPQVYQGGVGGGVIGGIIGGAPPPPPAPAPAAMSMLSRDVRAARKAAGGEALAEMAAVAPSGVTVDTGARELGELFEYSFSTPVTVKKNESAMLPFLQQDIDAKRLLIYSGDGETNPRTAAEIANNTGKTLDGGPITVFDNGAYAGEALVETVKSGDKRLISYGIDLGTRITTAFDSTARQVREIKAVRGVLTAKASREEVKTFTIRNVDARAKTLVIEHPARPGYKLLTPAAAERTTSAYRFTVPLKPSSTETFVVKEEFVYDETLAISSMTPNIIATYLRNSTLSAAGRQALEKIVALKEQIAASDARLRALEAERNERTQDQDRLRQNIQSLNSVSGQQQQVQKYATDLAAQETRLAVLRDQASAERQKKAALESELNGLLANLSF